MDDQKESFLISSTSSNKINHTDRRESESYLQSETSSSTAQLLERDVKQIQTQEKFTVKKVTQTREVRHFNAAGDLILDESNLPNSNDTQGNKNPSSINNANQLPNEAKVTHHTNEVNFSTQPQDGDGNPAFDQTSNPNLKILNQHDQQQASNESFYGSRASNFNSNYQNLSPSNGTTHLTGMLASQNNHQPLNYNQQQFVQPPQRTTSRNSSVPPSGYEELDYTLGYTSQQQPMGIIVNENESVDYGSKGPMHVPFLPNAPMIVQHNALPQNGVAYLNHKPVYDNYGTTGSVTQVPVITNTGIYGTRAVPESVYAFNQNGNLTFVTQPIMENANDVRWRDPELEEVISFLSSSDLMIRTNSVAYLQHLCFGDDHVKQRTRLLGGIPRLVDLLNRDALEVRRNVCGALRNLSYGRKNDDNKRAIRDAQGIQALIQTLVNNPDNEIRELATGVLWNLSSCEDIKWSIMDDALSSIVSEIFVPYFDWFKANLNNAQQFLPSVHETHWSTVIRNATGIIRNISSAGAHARKQLRDCESLIESLFFIINASISRNDVENKLIENCVCILRNLSYRCQETQDPDYDKHYFPNNSHTDSTTNSAQISPSSPSSSANLTTSLVGQVSSRVTDNLGCFGFGRKSKSKFKSDLNVGQSNLTIRQPDHSTIALSETRSNTLLPPHHPSNLQANGQSCTMVRTSTQLEGFNSTSATLPRSGISNIENPASKKPQGKELLWQPNVVKPYLALLSGCSNSETLEAAAGAIQNLAACYWQPSIDIRAAVRKERGLPVLVELLRMDRDRVVCVVATALRNLAIDQKNKELIGKYAMPDLVGKLSSGQNDQELVASDDTVAAVLATLHEVISNNADFVRSLYESGGLNKLTYIVRNRAKYSVRVQRFAAQVLLDMWKFTELRELYKKGGWKESHFVIRPQITSKASTYSVNSNTIERPMASQQADGSNSLRNLRSVGTYQHRDVIQSHTNMNGSNLPEATQMHDFNPQYGTVQMTPLNGQITNLQALYAQVDRQRKRNDITSREDSQMSNGMANNNC